MGELKPTNTGVNVVVVDGYSSGHLLAPALKQQGYKVIHVHSSTTTNQLFERTFNPNDYDYDFYHDGDLINTISKVAPFSPLAVIVGGERGVELTDYLSSTLGLPTNGIELSEARRNKYLMWEELKKSGLDVAQHHQSTEINDLLSWIKDNTQWPVVLKPLASGGTDNVHICNNKEEVKIAFDAILGKMNVMFFKNDAVLVQEYLDGTEYALNTVSSNGKHIVTDIWQYYRSLIAGAATVYNTDVLLPYIGDIQSRLIYYGLRVLDALGIKYGPAHTEIKMTKDGPRIVEMGARMCGSDFPRIVKDATGSSQVDLTIDAFLRPEKFAATKSGYDLLKYAAVVSLKSLEDGGIMSYKMVPELEKLLGVSRCNMYFKEGEPLPKTTDSDTVFGRVELLHNDPAVITESVKTIQEWERSGLFGNRSFPDFERITDIANKIQTITEHVESKTKGKY